MPPPRPEPPSPVSDVPPSGSPRPRAFRAAAPTGRLRLPRRRSGFGAAVSLLVHGVIVLILAQRGSAFLGGGRDGPGPRGGGAGGVEFFTLPAPSAIATVELPAAPAVAVPNISIPDAAVADLPPIALPPVVSPAPDPAVGAAGSGAAAGDGAGGGEGGGVGTETGSGTGGDARDVVPPNMRGMIVPPDNPPKAVRGRALRVQFWVGADGRVQRVAVTPEIPDDKYRRDFHQRMLNYLFYPAKTPDGRAVPGVVVITIRP